MTDRVSLLRSIRAGDIFSAIDRHGVPPLCIATAVNDETICARRMFMRDENFEFDRTTGIFDPEGVSCRINSIAPLPPDIRDVLLGLDHRYRTSNNIEDAKLTEPEKRALLFIYDHYRANQI